jgi:predicted nuclease of predicted toxin-antitoxin system
MKLLLDQNLSYKLVQALADIYPDCQHVRNIGLKTADDSIIWLYAKNNGYIIVSKDSDFHQRSFVWGYPPKVIWLKLGNCSTKMVENILRKHVDSIRKFDSDDTASFLILS